MLMFTYYGCYTTPSSSPPSHIIHLHLLLHLPLPIPSFQGKTITSMSRDIDTHDHYHLNGTLPADIPENLKQFLPEDEGLTYEEVILQQACVYQSYQECGANRAVATDDDDDDSGSSDESESVISQEVMDEAYARSLQELGEEFDEFFIAEFNATPDLNNHQDIDPANMRYEELLNLTEAVGVENVGLSAAHISQLPISIYTSGMFSNNMEDKCVICQENFKFGKRIITLPCVHQYHRKCIIKWLKNKKNCPVCQKEVV